LGLFRKICEQTCGLKWLCFANGVQASLGKLSGLFWSLAFAEPHTRPATVFLDEFNSGRLKRSSYYL